MPANTTDPLVSKFQPKNPDMVIWRYMDITAFLALVQTSSLHFALLESLEDPHEGRNTLKGDSLHYLLTRSAAEAKRSQQQLNKLIRSRSYVNCWTGSEHENAALWKIYSSSGTVVALRSTYNKLVDALPNDYAVGCVKYINYTKAKPLQFGTNSDFRYFHLVFHKRLEFSFEHEIRAAHFRRDDVRPNSNGMSVMIDDLSQLIDAVRIRSTEPTWKIKVVEKLCKHYKLSFSRSRIDDEPLFLSLTEEQREIVLQELGQRLPPRFNS